MRLTHQTDLSLRVLVYLSLIGDDRTTSQQIAEACGVSRNHLMKVVQKLASIGYIASTRAFIESLEAHTLAALLQRVPARSMARSLRVRITDGSSDSQSS